jgi:hypothetical protein
MLIDAIRRSGHVRDAEGILGMSDEEIRAQFRRAYDAIIELDLPARPFDEAFEREQLLRQDYVPGLLGMNEVLQAPFEFRTHARPIPVSMRMDDEPTA